MKISKEAMLYHEKMFPKYKGTLASSDPEFVAIFDNFAFDEVIKESKLDDKTRFIAILSVLLGVQAVDEFEVMVEAALHFDVTPNEIKEIVYQGCAYVGVGRVYPFLHAVNRVFKQNMIALPLDENTTTTKENRLQKGIEAQVLIFGDSMKDFYKQGPKGREHIHVWLAANCFGDYYTREILDIRQRELITFCFLYAQGGCEPQLLSHTLANIRLGNNAEFLMDVVSQCVPYIGYPRSLNAFTIIDEAQAKKEGD